MLPSVCIGVPTFNRAELLDVAVGSIVAQDYRGPLDCEVFDDGSTDDTRRVLMRWVRKMNLPMTGEVRATGNVNRGIAAAKNACLKAALESSADLIGILDSDDWHAPTFVSRCVEVLNDHPDVGLVYVDDVIVMPDGTERQAPAGDWSIETLLRCQIRGDGWLARRRFIAQVRHDERLKLDCDFDLFHALAKLTTFRRIPEPLHFVRQHDGRASAKRTEAAYWHAACLAKHGFGIEWAERRAEGRPAEILVAAREGYAHGVTLREADEAGRFA